MRTFAVLKSKYIGISKKIIKNSFMNFFCVLLCLLWFSKKTTLLFVYLIRVHHISYAYQSCFSPYYAKNFY
jgi:hypothetical protein